MAARMPTKTNREKSLFGTWRRGEGLASDSRVQPSRPGLPASVKSSTHQPIVKAKLTMADGGGAFRDERRVSPITVFDGAAVMSSDGLGCFENCPCFPRADQDVPSCSGGQDAAWKRWSKRHDRRAG